MKTLNKMANNNSQIKSWIITDSKNQSHDLNSFDKLSKLEQEQIKDIESFYNYTHIAT